MKKMIQIIVSISLLTNMVFAQMTSAEFEAKGKEITLNTEIKNTKIQLRSKQIELATEAAKLDVLTAHVKDSGFLAVRNYDKMVPVIIWSAMLAAGALGATFSPKGMKTAGAIAAAGLTAFMPGPVSTQVWYSLNRTEIEFFKSIEKSDAATLEATQKQLEENIHALSGQVAELAQQLNALNAQAK